MVRALAPRAHALAPLALALLAASCQIGSFGPRVGAFEPAHTGRGVMTSVLLRDRSRIDAELLVAREDGMLLLTGAPEVVYLPWAAVRQATFRQLRLEVSHYRAPERNELITLRHVSRHPQGLDDARLRTLLDAYGLAAVRAVTP